MLLVLLENPKWVEFNEGNLEILRPKMWEILNFDFFSLKFEWNYKKWVCKGKIS
jgi:hypothetical protein